MEEKILLVQGDDLPRVSLTVTGKDKQPVSLEGCTGVKLFFKQKGSTAPAQQIICEYDLATSKVEFEFASNELDTVLGDCEGELVLYYGAKKHTVWDLLQFTVRKSRQ